ncbi:uncharacterized protein LOC124436695 [Xenia sp. Carnegie-2017]|uniref:uncharacterized protein LOC124436695 n=1 Tax=Xenia sp. Carnegie-2017 TaxID=2897299 RepID=UPI001F049F63|nr:uncharacterized protein LOC124436695 [Xenia sp. Carnegie-2017]
MEVDSESEQPRTFKRVLNKDTNLRTEKKFIVYFTQLFELFKFCPICKSDDVLVEILQNGSMEKVKVSCSNQKCGAATTWNSQPVMTGTSIPAGNLLLSFAIFTAGTSATKVIRVLQHEMT